MSRKQPPIPPPEVKQRENPDVVTQVRTYKVITPLYGGGVEPGKADPITVVRATEVRGHLRFWWRATRGGAFKGDIKEMLENEEKIWGASAAPKKHGESEVKVSIIEHKPGSAFQAIDRRGNNIRNIGHPSSKDGYVAFPLREEQNPVLPENVEFKIQISFPKEYQQDVQSALWAWETFGGIGARTRRGFGALHCIEGSDIPVPLSDSVQQVIEAGLKKYLVSGIWPKGVPHLTSALRFKVVPGSDAVATWRELVKRLNNFASGVQVVSVVVYGQNQIKFAGKLETT